MIQKIGRELDKVELETVKTAPLVEVLLAIKEVIILALQLISLLGVFFKAERKEKIKAAIQRLKAAEPNTPTQ